MKIIEKITQSLLWINDYRHIFPQGVVLPHGVAPHRLKITLEGPLGSSTRLSLTHIMKPIIHRRRNKTQVIYYNGQKVGKITHPNWMFRLFLVAIFMLTFAAVTAGIMIGHVAYADQMPEVIKIEDRSLPRALEVICRAESGMNHKDKKGNVIKNINKNGTWDLGICQLNSIHFNRMASMGLNPYVEEDNKRFAKILFFEKGVSPWSASKSKWESKL